MEVRQQDSHLPVWRKHSLHAIASHQAISQTSEQILSRHLAWKEHIIGRILCWDWRQGHQSKNHQDISQNMEVQSTTDGRHQWCTMGTESITLQSTFHLAKHDISTKADRGESHHNTGGEDTSNWGSTTDGRRGTITKEAEGDNHRGDTSTPNHSTNIIAPSMTPAREPAGSPTSRRTLDDSITKGSTSKQQKTTTEQQTKERPEASAEPPRTNGRINGITVQLKNGQQVTTATCEDPTEAKVEQRLVEPTIEDPQRFDQEKLKQGRMKDMASMVSQGVFEEITLDQAREEEKRNIIGSKWVHRSKGDEVRSCIVGLRYDEVIKDSDDVLCINTTLCNPQGRPAHCIGKILEHQGRRHQHSIPPCTSWSNNKHLTSYSNHQKSSTPTGTSTGGWRRRCMVSGHHPKPGRDHLASIIQRTRLHTTHIRAQCAQASRWKSLRHGVCRRSTLRRETQKRSTTSSTRFKKKTLLRATRETSPGNTISFLGSKITNKGDHFDISLDDEYVENIFHEMKLNKCNPATTTGTTAGKANIEDEQLLDQQEHQQFRRVVGRLQWLAYTRPDISYYATKELARALQWPTIKDQKKLRHLVRVSCRYTRVYKFSIRPTIKLHDKIPQQLDLNIYVYVPSDWAGCHQTRRNTTGFVIEPLGTCIHFGSRTQAVVALSSAEAEFYSHRHWSTRSALHQELHHGSPEHKAHQRAYPHRQLSRKANGNKTRSIKTSKTHRTEIHVHPEPRSKEASYH